MSRHLDRLLAHRPTVRGTIGAGFVGLVAALIAWPLAGAVLQLAPRFIDPAAACSGSTNTIFFKGYNPNTLSTHYSNNQLISLDRDTSQPFNAACDGKTYWYVLGTNEGNYYDTSGKYGEAYRFSSSGNSYAGAQFTALGYDFLAHATATADGIHHYTTHVDRCTGAVPTNPTGFQSQADGAGHYGIWGYMFSHSAGTCETIGTGDDHVMRLDRVVPTMGLTALNGGSTGLCSPTCGTPLLTNSTTVSLTYAANDPNATNGYHSGFHSVDGDGITSGYIRWFWSNGSGWQSCGQQNNPGTTANQPTLTGTVTCTLPAQGTYSLTAVSQDLGGNCSGGATISSGVCFASGSTPVKARVTVDLTVPTVTGTTPQWAGRAMSWSESDSGGEPQATYHVDVATDSGYTNVISTSGDAAGTARLWSIPTTVTLTDDTKYYWRVRASDGTNWSSWWTGSFTYDAYLRGDDAYYQRVPFDLSGGYTLSVGMHNGEATLNRDFFSIPSYGPPQALSLTYSSLGPSSSGRFGYGWVSNLTQYLTFENGLVVWHRDDGGREAFALVGGTWTVQGAHYETMTTGSGTYIITMQDQTKLTFQNASPGRLLSIANRFGKALTLVWNTSSATATDASGRATTLTIDSANNRITEVRDSALRTWDFGYDASNNLTTITEPAPDPAHPTVRPLTTLGYDGSHRLTTITRVRSRASGSPQTVVWAVGYDSGTGKATSVTDPIGATVTPNASRDTFTYNAGSTVAGLLQTYNPVVRNTTTYTLDAYGRPTTILDPENWTTTQVFDGIGDLTSITRPINSTTNATTTYTYDARGNVLTETQPFDATHNEVAVNSYNATNDLLTQSRADNDASAKVVTLYTYDGAGHVTSEVDDCTSSGATPPSPASSCTGGGTHDASTNVTTAYSYTTNDQLQTETDPLGLVTLHTYDTYGNETSQVEDCTSSGTAPPVPSSSCTAGGTHDAATNVTTQTGHDTGVTAGKIGLPTSVTDPVGNVTTYTYDGLGRQLTEALPGDASVPAATTTNVYDEFGDPLTASVNWSGLAAPEVTTKVYDLVGRLSSTTDPATEAFTSTWDAANDEVSTVASGVTDARTFDHLGRVSTDTDAGVATTYTYDAQGNQLTATVTSSPTRSTTDTFDYAGDLLTEQVVAGGITTTQSHTYDVLGQELTKTDPAGIVTTQHYDRLGRQTQTVEQGTSLSTTTDFTYDATGRQTQATGPYPTGAPARVTTFTFGTLSRPATETDNVVQGSHDPSANVATTTYTDANGHTVATVDPRGIVTREILNAQGLPSQRIVNCTDSGTTPSTNPMACVGAGTHDGSTNLVTTFTYDGSGAVVDTTVDGASGNVVTEQTRDADGRSIKTVIDKGGLNLTTQTAYDAFGNAVATRDANGTDTRSFFDANGRLQETIVDCTDTGTTVPGDATWTTCAGGGTHDGTYNLVTTYTYDGQGNVATEMAPNGRVTSSTYDGADRFLSQTQNYVASPTRADQNLTTYFYYDTAGRQTATKAPTADRSTFAVTRVLYDDLGRVSSQIQNCTDSGTSPPANPATCGGGGTANADTNVVTGYGYDAAGEQVSLTAPSPAAAGTSTTTVITQKAYIDGRLCRVVENASGSTNLQTLSDPCSSPTQTGGTATTNVSTTYGYDAAGNLARMTDGQGDTTTYAYDGPGRLTGITDANGKTLAYGYDERGNRLSQTNRSDTTPSTPSITWTYDGGNRNTARAADGVTVTYTFDAVGNQLTAASSATGTITTTYDRLNRPLTTSLSTDGAAGTSHTYALTSTSWTDPTGAYQASLDAFNRQVSLTDPIHGSTPFTTTYRADGAVATTGDPVGNSGTVTYDNLGRVTTKSIVGGGAINRASYTWTVNRAGNELSEVSTVAGDPTNGTATYAYDPLGRLTSYGRTGAQTETYSWQAVPNRATKQIGTGTVVTTSYDPANRPLSDTSGASYSNDLDGRLTAAPGQTLDWDSLGHLLDVKDASSGSTIAAYTYDALDRLLVVDHPSVSRIRFRYIGPTHAVAQEVDDSSGSVVLNVANGVDGQPIEDWTVGAGTVRVYGLNEHGDITWVGSSSGAVSGTLRYDPWGNTVGSSGSMPDWRWQGSWIDATTGLLHTQTRWYSSTLARFLSEDSLVGNLAAPANLNLYSYGQGDPLNRDDPSGRSWLWVRPGDTLRSLAQRYLGSMSHWPTIFNFNRVAITNPYFLRTGQCLYVAQRVHSDLLCSGQHTFTPTPRTVDPTKRVEQAAQTLGQNWYDLDQPNLVSLTQRLVQFSTAKTFSAVLRHFTNALPADLAAAAIAQLPFSSTKTNYLGHGFNLVEGNLLLPAVLGPNVNAITLGYYIFADQPGGNILIHEYIHTLQYQAIPHFIERYLHLRDSPADIFGALVTGQVPAEVNGDVTNPYEAIAYLWQYQDETYGRFVRTVSQFRFHSPWEYWRY